MIAIGGSLGGTEAVREVLRQLPADFPLPIAVVLHRHKESERLLVPMIQQGVALPVIETEDKEPIAPGRVYLCPPDYHLMVDQTNFTLSIDEPVNFARPSVDALFDSVADWYGAKAVAVVLTGGGTDGSRGAARIHQLGGKVLVQNPRTAEGPWMPLATLAAVPDARSLTLSEIAATLMAHAAAGA